MIDEVNACVDDKDVQDWSTKLELKDNVDVLLALSPLGPMRNYQIKPPEQTNILAQQLTYGHRNSAEINELIALIKSHFDARYGEIDLLL